MRYIDGGQVPDLSMIFFNIVYEARKSHCRSQTFPAPEILSLQLRPDPISPNYTCIILTLNCVIFLLTLTFLRVSPLKECEIASNNSTVNHHLRPQLARSPYSPTILKNVFTLFLQKFLYSETFENNATCDWLNHTVWPIEGCVTFKSTKY